MGPPRMIDLGPSPDAPEKHACLRGTPLRQTRKMFIQSTFEHISLLAIEGGNSLSMGLEPLVPPRIQQCECDDLRERRRLQVRRCSLYLVGSSD